MKIQCIRLYLFVLFVTFVCSLPSSLLFAQARQPAQLGGAETKQTELAGDEIEYGEVKGAKLTGYLSLPDLEDSSTDAPAIILIHEWWGLNDDIRRKADRFASDGFVALAVDLYGEEATADRGKAREMAMKVRANMEDAFENLKSAVSFLADHDQVDKERMASIGWCFGGGWSYQIAKNNLGVKASVIYYGPFNPADDLEKMKATIIGHFAENDRGISIDNVKEFQAKLKTLNGDHEIFIYPNTQHGFASREGENPVFVKDAAELAHKRTMEFLQTVVGQEK